MARPTITIEDMRSLARPISGNIDNNTFDAMATEAEDIDLQQFLGPKLYAEFIDDIDTGAPPSPANEKLFDGGEYDPDGDANPVKFRGVKQLLCYLTYARLVVRQEQNVTRFGVKVKNAEQSSAPTQGLIDQERNDANGVAVGIKTEIRDFLDRTQSDYPLWNKKTTFDFRLGVPFRAGPRVIRP